MAKFSQTSFSKLASCHIDLQAIFYEVIKNVDCIVLEGFRGQAAQERDFLEKRTTLEWPHGKHNSNPSNAVDVAPYPINWEDKESFYWFGGYVLATAQMLKDQGKISCSLRWGGDWNGNKDFHDQDFTDLVHFERMT